MKPQSNRRHFLKHSGLLAVGSLAAPILPSCSRKKTEPGPEAPQESPFKISLAQWSLHKALKSGELDNLEFPQIAKDAFGIDAIEWVNQFFFVEHEKLGYQPKDATYLAEMKKRVDDLGSQSLLVMCDRVGNLGDPSEGGRSNAVEGHFAWVEAAKTLGCHSIRVNARSNDNISPEKQRDLCVDGLSRLSEFASQHGLNVIVENHGGLSSNGAWLASVMQGVGRDNCGTLPDYGNFFVAKKGDDLERYNKQKAPYIDDPIYVETGQGLEYDRYQGVKDLMPFAKGVSAKAHDFDENGEEIHTDFAKMMQIVADSGYKGYIGIEYEGSELGEPQGIKKTKELLERVIAGVA